MSKITLSFDANEITLTESVGVDAKGKPVTWVNFNLAPIVAPFIVELAKAKGYDIPAAGLSWSCQKKNYQGLGAGFVKMAAPVEAPKPAKNGETNSALEEKLARLEAALAMLLTQTSTVSHAPDAKPAPVGTTITRKPRQAKA